MNNGGVSTEELLKAAVELAKLAKYTNPICEIKLIKTNPRLSLISKMRIIRKIKKGNKRSEMIAVKLN